MRILWVKPGKLFPPDTGGKLRTYNILRHLSRIENVTYLSYYQGPRDMAYEHEILQHFPGAVSVPDQGVLARGFRRYVDYTWRLPSAVPYSVGPFTSPAVQKMLADWFSRDRFDLAICDFLASSLNFPNYLSIPTVLFQHNVESHLWKRRAEFETNWLDRLTAKIEYAKIARFEPDQVRRFDHVLAVSENDRREMIRMTDPERISVVPTGVDLSKCNYEPDRSANVPLVVFTGSMDWAPNVDAVEYFCKEIWPNILAAVSGARFRIVGRDPHPRVRRLASSSVEVTGTVPSIAEHIRDAAVLVVPLRIGGGTRIKIYEGMAMGRATVSTTVGAEGLDVNHEQDIFLADDPRQFGDYTIQLLRDEKMRRRYEVAAVATAQKYNWWVIVEHLVELLREIVSRTARSEKQMSLS